MGTLLRNGGGGWIVLDGKPSPPSPLVPFHQRLNNNRSPLESPPVAKKLPKVRDNTSLKVRDGNLFFGHMFVDVPSSNSGTPSPVYLDLADGGGGSGSGKENRSILKRSGGGGFGPRGRSVAQRRSAGRRVDFDQDVVVYHFDRAEGGHVASESQRLNSDQKDRKEFVNRTVQGRYRPIALDTYATKISLFGQREPPIRYAVPLPVTSSSSSSQQYAVAGESPLTVTSQQYVVVDGGTRHHQQHHHHQQQLPVDQLQLPPVYYTSSMLDRCRGHERSPPPTEDEGQGGGGAGPTAESSQEVDFSFFEDDQHRLRLKFSLALGDGVAAGDVLVKANTTGNKVRIVGTRTVGTSRHGTIIRQEFTERYQLPMEVDPYMITARMDNGGNLYVEAPVLTVDRRRALATERQTVVNGDVRLSGTSSSSSSSDFLL